MLNPKTAREGERDENKHDNFFANSNSDNFKLYDA